MFYLFIFISEFLILLFLSRILSRSISAAIYKITNNAYGSLRIFHFIFLPGVIVHELAHLISAEVMFVKTHGLSLTPVRNGDQLTMGSVQIEKTDPIRRAIIGFAPVLVGIVLIGAATFYLLSDKSPFGDIINYFLIFIIVFEIGNTMFSSRRDIEGTVELLIVSVLVIGLLFVLGISFQPVIDFINSSSVQSILLNGIKLLWIPIAADIVIILLTKFLVLRK